MTRAIRSFELGTFALKDPRREAYCRLRAENMPQQQAFEQAGLPTGIDSRGRPWSNASRLERSKDISARIRYLVNQATEFAGVRRVHVVNRLDRVGRANLADFFESKVHPDGSIQLQLRDITALPREITDALAGLEWDADGRPKIRLHNRNEANIALLRFLGIPDQDDEGHGHRTMNIFNVLSIDDQLALASLLEALPGRAGDAGSQIAGERDQAGTPPETL